MPLFFLGLAALSAVWATRPLWYDPESARLCSDLARARNALQDPQAALNGLTVVLNEDLGHISRLPDRAGEAHFLLGSTYLRLAEQVPAEPALDLWHKARFHLEKAEQLGVPESDRPLLRYRLGKAWYHTGGDIQRVIDYLSAVIDQVEEDRASGYAILTQCYLRLPVPNLPAALQANEKQLQLPTSDESRLAPARLLRGELLLRMQQREAARKVLGWIKEAPPALVARARYLRARSYQEEEAWAEAAQLWEEVLAEQRQPPADKGLVLYFLGLCYRNLHRAADAARAWTRAAEENGEEGQAARLRLANLQIEIGNVPAALELYERALGTLVQPAAYHNRFVNLLEASQLLASDCRACKDAGRFADAEKLARLYSRLVAPGPAQALLGQIMQAWAEAQLARSRQLQEAVKARQEAEAARAHFREAALSYQGAAQATAGQPDQTDWLWRAAACFLKGEDFAAAVAAYRRFVDLQPRPSPAQLCEAWYRLGEAQRALHDDRAAAEAYRNCIATGGLFAYRARYQLAMAEVAGAHYKDAEEMLEHNLELLELTGAEPDREAHEKTLYALAEVLFVNREFSMATWRYEQALALYPASAAAFLGRYRLAQSYRHLADRGSPNLQPREALSAQVYNRTHFTFWLEKAAAHFQKLVDDLQARQAAAPLPEADARLLSQARFALAECRFDLGSYAEAVPLYSGLANQYAQQVEGLTARKQLYRCYVTSAETEQPGVNLQLAQHTLEEMRQTLEQLDESAFQGRPESEQRAAWERWVKTEEERLQKLGLARPPK